MTDRSRPPISDAFKKALIDGLTFQKWDTPLHRVVEELGLAMASHPGFKRRRNEDRTAVANVQCASGDRYTVAIVCDGVGGSENGDRAATLAIASVILELCAQQTKSALGPLAAKLVRCADDFVRSELKGRGTTTMALLLATPNGDCIGTNIGDSRIYSWVPAGEFDQVTVDDTVENELKALPGDHRAMMQAHNLRGRISQAIGEPGRGSDELRVVVVPRSMFRSGAILGTDGLWRAADSFPVVMSVADSASEAARRAVQLANLCGGVDNASIVAIADLQKFSIYQPTYVAPLTITVTLWANESRLVFIADRASSHNGEPRAKASTVKAKRKTFKGGKPAEVREPELPLEEQKQGRDARTVERADPEKTLEPKPAIEVTLDKAPGHE